MNCCGCCSFRAWFWSLALLGFAADKAAKYAVWDWLKPNESREPIPGYFTLTHQGTADGKSHYNQGALLGVLHEKGKLANWFFAGITALAVVVIIVWSFKPALNQSLLLSSALGLILAGAMGNLYDRLVFPGVRDLMIVHLPRADGTRINLTAVFNLADFFLICGAGLLLIQALFSKSEVSPSQATEMASSAKP